MEQFSSISSATTEWLLRSAWQSTVLAGIILIVQTALRNRLSPRWRHALWYLLVARLLLPALPESTWSVYNLAHRARETDGIAATYGALDAISSQALNRSNELKVDLPGSAPVVVRTDNVHALSLSGILFILWLAGLIFLSLRISARLAKLRFVLRSSQEVGDSRALCLFNECKNQVGVKGNVALYASSYFASPTLVGCLRPRLHMPAGLLQRFGGDELRLIFLHELAHVKRKDLLGNWLCTAAHLLHWYNPVIWFALRRMRADREMACDAFALTAAGEHQRNTYGEVIIRLLEGFSARRNAVGTLGILEGKDQIQERIRMIARFRVSSPQRFLAIALLAAIGTFCLTDADTPDAQSTPNNLAAPSTKNSTTLIGSSAMAAAGEAQRARLATIRQVYEARQREMLTSQKELDELRTRLRLSDLDFFENHQAETLERIQRDRVSAEARYLYQKKLVETLKSKSRADLRKIIPTVCPDAAMDRYFGDLAKVEQQYAALVNDLGPEHPEVVRAVETMKKINQQIEDRIDGVLDGQELQLERDRALLETLAKRANDSANQPGSIREDYARYFDAKRKVEEAQRTLDVLRLRMLSEEMDNPAASAASEPQLEASPGLRKRYLRIERTPPFLYLDQRAVTISELQEEFSRLVKQDPNLVLMIDADEAPIEELVKALNAAVSAQLKVQVKTRERGSAR